MKLATPFVAKSVLQMSVEDVRPSVSYPVQPLLNAIGARYGFAHVPTLEPSQLVLQVQSGGAVLPGQPLAFQMGIFEYRGTRTQVTQLEIVSGAGLCAVTARDTDQGDAFMDDLISYLESEFGYRDIKAHSKRVYGSSIIIQFDDAIENHISGFLEIGRVLSDAISLRMGAQLDFAMERLTFSSDPQEAPARVAQFLSSFIIERRINHPYSENRFFSTAPLQTGEHMSVLERIEKILLARKR